MSQVDRSRWPRLTISSSISPSRISLSNPTKEPVIISANLRLLNSTQPISFLTSGSFLDNDFRYNDNNIALFDAATNQWMPEASITICTFANQHSDSAGPDNLITLYPGVQQTFDVNIGVKSWRETVTQSEEFHLSATKLSELEAGRNYKVRIDDGFRWKEFGDVESIMRARVPTWKRLLGVRRFYTEEDGIKVESVLINEPEIEVVV